MWQRRKSEHGQLYHKPTLDQGQTLARAITSPLAAICSTPSSDYLRSHPSPRVSGACAAWRTLDFFILNYARLQTEIAPCRCIRMLYFYDGNHSQMRLMKACPDINISSKVTDTLFKNLQNTLYKLYFNVENDDT